VRGDEGQRCNQLAQYRSVRVPRSVTEDVEMAPEMENVRKRLHKKFGKYQLEEDEDAPAEEQNEDTPEDMEAEGGEGDEGLEISDHNIGLVDVASNQLSACPVENGVLRSLWGGFSAGPVIAGLAAGMQPQTISVTSLLADGSRMGQMRRSKRQAGNLVDNRFAATLSGDIAEAVLRQAPTATQVGACPAGTSCHNVSSSK